MYFEEFIPTKFVCYLSYVLSIIWQITGRPTYFWTARCHVVCC